MVKKHSGSEACSKISAAVRCWFERNYLRAPLLQPPMLLTGQSNAALSSVVAP